MYKRIICLLLVLAMAAALVPVVSAADHGGFGKTLPAGIEPEGDLCAHQTAGEGFLFANHGASAVDVHHNQFGHLFLFVVPIA